LTSLILYTPGHNIYTDTLIMHGMVRVMAETGCTRGVVRRIGEAYMVQYRGCQQSGSDIRDTASLHLLSLYMKMLMHKNTMDLETPYLSKLRDFKVFCAAQNYINRLASEDLGINIDKYSGAKGLNHRASAGEGRSPSRGGKGNTTLYLPLCPLCGKYSTVTLLRAGELVQGYRGNEQYKVCRDCFVLALIGFMWGTSMLSFRTGGSQAAYVFAAAPLEASVSDVLLFQRAFSDPKVTHNGIKLASDLPATAAALAFASILDVPLRRGASMELLQWRLEKRGNQRPSFVQPVLPFSRLLAAVASIRYVAPEWPLFVQRRLGSRDAVNDVIELLDEIYNAVMSGSMERLYNAARLLASIEAKSGPPIIPGEALAAALRAGEGHDPGHV